ncbi:hypothetical protein J4471_04510 [Candidatus Woesearchaeota archaeon]|nr:hypothetical protein [Candidatus Woesearchaeota archaeon]
MGIKHLEYEFAENYCKNLLERPHDQLSYVRGSEPGSSAIFLESSEHIIYLIRRHALTNKELESFYLQCGKGATAQKAQGFRRAKDRRLYELLGDTFHKLRKRLGLPQEDRFYNIDEVMESI